MLSAAAYSSIPVSPETTGPGTLLQFVVASVWNCYRKLAVLAHCSTSADLFRSSPFQHLPKTVMMTHTLTYIHVPIYLFLPSNHQLFLTHSIHLPSHCSLSTSLRRSSLYHRLHPSILYPRSLPFYCSSLSFSFSSFSICSLHSVSVSVCQVLY